MLPTRRSTSTMPRPAPISSPSFSTRWQWMTESGGYRIAGMPNAHSHAFQRLLRAVAERPSGPDDSFWSWRDAMYALADSLDPDGMRRDASATFAEMARSGYGAVGEFHYVHHQPGGEPYADSNEMAIAVAQAAIDQELPIVLLPAAYHRAGWDGSDLEPDGAQRRFADADVDVFLERVERLRAWADSK